MMYFAEENKRLREELAELKLKNSRLEKRQEEIVNHSKKIANEMQSLRNEIFNLREENNLLLSLNQEFGKENDELNVRLEQFEFGGENYEIPERFEEYQEDDERPSKCQKNVKSKSKGKKPVRSDYEEEYSDYEESAQAPQDALINEKEARVCNFLVYF